MTRYQKLNAAIERAIAEAIAAEREACAQIADEAAHESDIVALSIAEAIRARGPK